MSPEEGLQDDQRAGAPLLWRKVDGTGLFQIGEDKVLRDLIVAFHYLKGAHKQEGEQLLYGLIVVREGGIVLN